MVLKQIEKTTHTVRDLTEINKSTFILRVERRSFQFRAGQFVNISLPNGNTSREYSVYSGENENYLEFLIKEIPDGFFTPLLKSLAPGDTVDIDGPYDEMFTLENNNLSKLHYLICTGTGIAPFNSYVRTYPTLKYHIIHGIRYKEDLLMSQNYSEENYTSCVSKDSGGNFSGRVTSYIKSASLTKDSYIYLCGNSNMVFDTKDYLLKSGFREQQMFTELFF